MSRLSATRIKEDIDGVISALIGCGVCDDSNFSSVRKSSNQIEEVTFSAAESISFALGDTGYDEIYKELADKRSYNLKFIDGALIQMMYRFESDQLRQHRLVFYPSPSLLQFQDDPESYMRDDIFLEIIQRKIVPFPLRFDFDARDEVHVDVLHPVSHLTLGDVKGCRIPVTAAITPRWFIEFILRNFYQTTALDFVGSLPKHKISLDSTITANEMGLMHLVVPYK